MTRGPMPPREARRYPQPQPPPRRFVSPREATTPHPALIEAFAADVDALREARGITYEQAYDAMTLPDWAHQYAAAGGNMNDLGNRVINKAKSIGRARGPVARESHRVADFNTLDDLIDHARDELGATHVSGSEANTKLYFPRGGQYPYEEASVWRKSGYWHAQGPGARTGVSRLPAGAQPIGGRGRRAAETRHVRDYAAIDPRGRTIAGPFKSYSDAKQAAGPADVVQFVPQSAPPRASEARRQSAHHSPERTRRRR